MVLARTRRARLFVYLRVLAALSGAVACSPRPDSKDPSSGEGGAPDAAPSSAKAGCPHDLPPSCPSPEPSWGNDVRMIVSDRCNACHGAGGVEQPRFDFSTYQGVHDSFGSILSNVYGCHMPPPDAGGLSVLERQELLGWLVCAAPNN